MSRTLAEELTAQRYTIAAIKRMQEHGLSLACVEGSWFFARFEAEDGRVTAFDTLRSGHWSSPAEALEAFGRQIS